MQRATCSVQHAATNTCASIYSRARVQVSDKLYNQIRSVCGVEQLQRGVTDPACSALVAHMEQQLGGYYGYNLYDECGAENLLLSATRDRDRRYWSAMPPTRTAAVDGPAVGSTGALNDYPCGGVGAMLKWLNTSAVKHALNVPASAKFFLTDNGVGFNYSITEKNLMPFYRQLAAEGQVRVLVYNGDTDPGINSFVAQNWTAALGFAELQEWRPWTLDGKQRVGGYVTRYAGSFDFLTIRGSGHMVPE